MLKKLLTKKFIIVAIVAFVILFTVFQLFSNGNKQEYKLFEAKIDNIYQSVSETGNIKIGGKIDMGFKSSGTLSAIYVSAGDEVFAGQALVKLNTNSLNIQLQEALANLEISQARFNQLLSGATEEEINITRTTLENAKVALSNTIADAEEDLNQAYDSALTVLDSSYSKASTALNEVITIKRIYFSSLDQEGVLVTAKKNEMEVSLNLAKEKIDIAKLSKDKEDIESALIELKNSLEISFDALVIIRETTDSTSYKDIVSSTYKTSLDNQKTNVNTALTSVLSSQQSISSTKINNQTSINTAQGAVQTAENQLALQIADPREEDVALYQAQVKQAQARVDILENDIAESTLRSPVRGTVAKVNVKIGETVQPGLTEPVVTVLPFDPYEIETYIYEEDIVRVEINNPVKIELIAFPNKTFLGKVISIDPAEELIEGVVYYTVAIAFNEETPEGLKPGMTADIVITTDSKENVLTIPEDAIIETENKTIVKILKDKEVEEREVEIGLTGNDGLIEIISGIQEGEKIILD